MSFLELFNELVAVHIAGRKPVDAVSILRWKEKYAMKLLLHICCAPCSVACIQQLRGEGIEPVGYWYNPNIHPFTEYRARNNCLIDYAKSIGLELILEDEYGLRPFVQAVCGDIDHRCGHCYACRFEQTARYAAEHGFDAFTTTLSVSPYQNFELICATGETMGS